MKLFFTLVISVVIVIGQNLDWNFDLNKQQKIHFRTPNSVVTNDNNEVHSLRQKKYNTDLKLVRIKGRYYYPSSGLWLNQSSAVEFCQDHDMQLLSIETEEERLAIEKYFLRRVGGKHAWYFYTSGIYDQDTGKFMWKPSNVTIPLDRFEPLSHNVNYTCVNSIRNRSDKLMLNDADCNSFRPLMCEQVN